MKPKLFLKTQDIQAMTGQCERTARKIMTHIRRQKTLPDKAPISIYAFSEVFSIPPDVLFCYINLEAFRILPITRDELSQLTVKDLTSISEQLKRIDPKYFKGFTTEAKLSEGIP